MTKQYEEKTVKAPHYFLVHFVETLTTVNNAFDGYGQAYPIWCDGFVTNVYGFRSKKEADAFDPLELRNLLRGGHARSLLFDANTEQELMEKINNDQRVKDGVFTLTTITLTE